MTGHVFISYSHLQDGPYVQQLAEHLSKAGIPVWFDREIISGNRWVHVIRDHIDTCSAFIVVMTPSADASDWVTREIAQAEDMQRPIFPLLLEGRRFFSLAHIQYEDVTHGGMPGETLLNQLRGLVAPDLEREIVALRARFQAATEVANTGSTADAARHFGELIAEYTSLLGADHLETLLCRSHLAGSLQRAGDNAEAARIFRDLVADYTRLLGPDHPNTLNSRYNFAANIGPSGDWAAGARLLREVAHDYERIYGVGATEALPTRVHLAASIAETGDWRTAAKQFGDLVSEYQRAYGADHVETLLMRHNLALSTGRSGQRQRAAEEFQTLSMDLERVLGPDHPRTVDSRERIAEFRS